MPQHKVVIRLGEYAGDIWLEEYTDDSQLGHFEGEVLTEVDEDFWQEYNEFLDAEVEMHRRLSVLLEKAQDASKKP